MICISINQESRRLALVDMLNAAPQCDLLEIRLDRFDKAPELSELLAHKPRPVIMSCRRPQEGGNWTGSEAERLALLRQCIVSKADYVEIELDVADEIRKFPPAKRVISYTVQPGDRAADIQDRYEEAQTKHPDVIKLTTLARTPEEAWPLVQILAKASVPTIVVGLGKPGIMLTILGKKIGAPWTYAALERGMESYPGQPTAHELRQVYHYQAIGRGTRLVGVTGFGEKQYYTVAALNAALAHLGLSARCLPVGVGGARLFGKVVEAVKLAAVVVDAENQETLLELARERHATVQHAGVVDLLVHKGQAMHGYFTRGQALAAALERRFKELAPKGASDDPLKNRLVMVVGVTPLTRTLVLELARRGASVIIASRKKKAASELAASVGCRFIQLEAMYSTLHHALIICDEEKEETVGGTAGGVHHGVFKPKLVVLDAGAAYSPTELLREAADRGCDLIEPRSVLLEEVDLLVRLITGKHVPREVLAATFSETMEG